MKSLAFALGLVMAPVAVRAQATVAPSSAPAPGDSLSAAVDLDSVTVRRSRLAFPSSPFDAVSQDRYLRRHAFTVDHHLELEPTMMVSRRGPIGYQAFVSRWGIGRGRALVLFGPYELNNPQSGVAPFAHLATSGLDTLRIGGDDGSALLRPSAPEGVLQIVEKAPPLGRPYTFVELSKGSNDLRQRRFRMSSAAARVGIDLSYDELLNDGYAFDTAANIDRQFGQSSSRNVSFALRGRLAGDETWAMGFRRFSANTVGDIDDPLRDDRESGHLATMSAQLGAVSVDLFERGFRTTVADSHAVNVTRALYAGWLGRTSAATAAVRAGVEDIAAEQVIAAATSNIRVRRVNASAEVRATAGGGGVARAWLTAATLLDYNVAWGGGAEFAQRLGTHAITAQVQRTYRMPSLGEMFVPTHSRAGLLVQGNAGVDPEHMLEGSLRLCATLGPLCNEAGFTTLRAGNPILFAGTSLLSGPALVPVNSDAQSLGVFDDRARLDLHRGSLSLSLWGGVAFANGRRQDYFSGVPEWRATAGVRAGSELFGRTSALYGSVEVEHTGARDDIGALALAANRMVHASLDGRLVDARLYAGLYNALDERYETVAGRLMTPRTVYFGIAWPLFD